MKLTMFRLRHLVAGLGLLLACTGAHAQASRTWVSGVGDDANPCSRTAPCKTFAGAISKTAAGGVINVLDPGGFGGVTITKSITIDGGPNNEGSITSGGAGTTSIIINAGAADVVVIRNLTLYGLGNGLNGIKFIAGDSLYVDNVTIHGYRATNGNGILFAPTVPGTHRLYVANSTLINNGAGTDGGGLRINPAGGTTFASASINNSRISANIGYGIKAIDNTFATVSRSYIEGNQRTGIHAISFGLLTDVAVHDTVLNDNGAIAPATEAAVIASGANAFVHLSGNVISQNEVGLKILSGGHIGSFSNNRAMDNTTNGAANQAETNL
jgi:hypothetical protein